jgi:signal transduction histidine kinase
MPHDGSFDPSQVTAAEIGKPPFWKDEDMPNGRRLFVYTMSYPSSGDVRYAIQAGASDDQITQTLNNLLLSLTVVLPIIVGVSIGGGFLLLRNALRPLRQIATVSGKITSRNLNERLPLVHTGDEIEKLTEALNRMMSRLEDSFHHVQRFSADVSHEIRTPLAIIRAELEDLLQTASLTADAQRSVQSALEEAERLSRIAEQLLEMTRLEAGEQLSTYARFDLADMTSSTVDQMRLLADEKHVELRFSGTTPVSVIGDPMRIRQIVVNLVDNAIKYTPANGSIIVRTFPADSKAVLEVHDTGIGIPNDAIPHLFERFYRVDGARSRQLGGTASGLRLSNPSAHLSAALSM